MSNDYTPIRKFCPSGPENEPMRSQVLHEACRLINGPRQEAYGDFGEFTRRAAQAAAAVTGLTIEGKHIGMIMACIKLVRMETEGGKDSAIDLAGYAALQQEFYGKD